MRYAHLTKHPNVFLSASGLREEEFDELIEDVQAQYMPAEQEGVSGRDRVRAIGGGQSAGLSAREQILMGVVWRRL